MGIIPNGHHHECAPSRMDSIPKEHHTEWTPYRMDTIPNGHHPEWTQSQMAPSKMDIIPNGYYVFSPNGQHFVFLVELSYAHFFYCIMQTFVTILL